MAYLLAMTIPVAVIALLVTRMQYRKYGNLTTFGVFLLCVMLFLPNLVVHYVFPYEMPATMVDYVGVIIGVFGLVVCVLGMLAFRSVEKILCQDASQLTITGLYQWSRNPQYVGWLLFLTGFAMNGWSLWCFAALSVVAVSLHFLVLIEEEHLRRIFGQQYVEFCQKVSRYFPLP